MAAAAAAAGAVDRLPLGAAGFTPQTLQAACDFLSTADPSKLLPCPGLHGKRPLVINI